MERFGLKQLGFKQLLLISVMLLVGVSVSVACYLSYITKEEAITRLIREDAKDFVAVRAAKIELKLKEKTEGVEKIGEYYKSRSFPGNSAEDYIMFTKTLAGAFNTGSAWIGFESSGDAYWNQETESWPNHKLNGDVRKTGYYQTGRESDTPSITKPYLSVEGDIYWMSIAQKTKDGVFGTDVSLSFLAELVDETGLSANSDVIIFTEDSTVLASSYSSLPIGEKATEHVGFRYLVDEIVSNKEAVIERSITGRDKIFFSRQIKIAGKSWFVVLGLDRTSAFQALHEARTKAITTTIVATLLSLIIAFFIIQLLYRPIVSLKAMVQDLADGTGDLTQRLPVAREDDLSQIARSVNSFIESLQDMIIDIQGVSVSLQENVERLKNQSSDNSAILQAHVSETEQIVTAIEEMNSTATSMATDAVNTAALTQQANTTSNESHKIVQASQETVSALITDVDGSSEYVQKMSEETQSINTILSVIGEIAEQTNLLALNAAIEAARAGDQGRGFAVVADEVRNLASRTKESTEEIETALKRLLAGSKLVVDSMDSTKKRCHETAEGAGEVASSLEVVTGFVSDINDLSTQIATAAEEQSSVTSELSRNMTAINDIVSKLDTNGKKALTDAESISTVNSQLVSIVNRFRI